MARYSTLIITSHLSDCIHSSAGVWMTVKSEFMKLSQHCCRMFAEITEG